MGERTELAETRTDMAEDRTLLANERTFAGWMRTGLSAVGIGLGFNLLFDTMEPTWAPKAISTIFMIVGIYVFFAAERRACQVTRKLESHQVSTFGKMNLRVVAGTMIAASALLIAAIWLLEI